MKVDGFKEPEPRPAIEIEKLDLRSVTRDSDLFFCNIAIETGDYSQRRSGKELWIECGRFSVQFPERRGARPTMLSARALAGVTDFEHDSAHIFQIPIAGWSIDFIDNGITWAEAAITGDAENLRVPMKKGYDPTQLGAGTCAQCATPHPFVSEGLYAGPPVSEAFWRRVVGRRLEIVFGPVNKDSR